MWLTNSSSQIASTPQVCLRVMADVTPGQILNKGGSSQLVSIMLESQEVNLGLLGLLPQLTLVLKGASFHFCTSFTVAQHSKKLKINQEYCYPTTKFPNW